VLLQQATNEANKCAQEKKLFLKPSKPGYLAKSLKENRGEEVTATIASQATIRATRTDSLYQSMQLPFWKYNLY